MTLHWGFLPALVVLAVLHYLLSALALRTVSGRPLPLGEATLTQFTAATANRLTPGGIGAAAVNARYLSCRGVTGPRAIAAVAALHATTAVGDSLLFGTVLALGGGAGLLSGFGPPPLPVIALIVAACAAILTYAWFRRGRTRLLEHAREMASALADLLRRPRRMALTLAACAGTTLVLGTAFALSVLAVPGAAAPDLVTLLAAYFVGSTAGSAVPVPSAIGSTEAAMIAALGGAGVHPTHALTAVVLFRTITFWAPVPVGIVAGRALRRRALEPAAVS